MPAVEPAVILDPFLENCGSPPNNRRAVAEVPPGSLLKALEITYFFTGKIFFKN